jgi:hypothetical protein
MAVKLFIYQDDTLYSENAITADNTLITADNTFITADQTFELTPFTSRISKQIDLFDDEVINVTSSIQNINDISKVFTDYSQSFTIPASKNNNETFRYWHENEVDNGFNQLIRYDGFIEIDDQIFRVGKWQLESASVKQNKIENYKITFFGILTSLIERFGEEKLKDITDLNTYGFSYSGAGVLDKITTTSDSDILFPLISSNRVWEYGSGGSNNIHHPSGHINHTELFPALKLSRIFDAIENRYGITFDGDFLTQSRFTKAYLWLKNRDLFLNYGRRKKIEFNNIINNNPFVFINNDNIEILPITTNQGYQNQPTLISINSGTSSNWQVIVYQNASEFFVLNGSGFDINFTIPQIAGTYQVYLTSSQTITYDGSVTSSFTEIDIENGTQTIYTSNANVVPSSTSNVLDLVTFMPDIKVSDFFSGILKMFNLTAFSYSENNYTLEQLENWYYQGEIKNLTQYTITDIEFERIKPYKKVNFSYEKSESFLNRRFFDNTQNEYGNLIYSFNNDGPDYSIKLPFENLLFNKFTDTNLQVGYSLNKDFSPYIPKPIILYQYENADCSFYFNDGAHTTEVTNYNVMGQDVDYQNTPNTLNWGIEYSSYLLETIDNSLFKNYYFDYLNNLYSLKSRMAKVSMILPYSELVSLKLNDRIVIRDKRYIINQFTTNLKTFEVQLELIQDFRNINFNNSLGRTTDSSAKTLRFDTTSNAPLNWIILSDPTSKIIAINNFNTYVEVEIKANTTGVDQVYSIISNKNDIIVITQNG